MLLLVIVSYFEFNEITPWLRREIKGFDDVGSVESDGGIIVDGKGDVARFLGVGECDFDFRHGGVGLGGFGWWGGIQRKLERMNGLGWNDDDEEEGMKLWKTETSEDEEKGGIEQWEPWRKEEGWENEGEEGEVFRKDDDVDVDVDPWMNDDDDDDDEVIDWGSVDLGESEGVEDSGDGIVRTNLRFEELVIPGLGEEEEVKDREDRRGRRFGGGGGGRGERKK
eukprot:TRINITY_DN2717_c0_g1_i14.p1 TRINITY_DN2717_c0_g1~~TRINITY_DN2717_c0_g1_i14.p1  ORF type:complete len:224 (+),score=68.12 TRINITY_DN2717_c0_g1_i14:281-952(+)